jgi:protein TonB
MKKSHPLIDEKNLKGETPLLLQDMKPGNYLLGISPIIVLDRNFKMREIDRSLTVKSLVVFGGVPPSYPPPKEDSKGAVVYSVTKEENTPLRVIVLAYSDDTGLEELKARYPADEVFQFDEQGFLEDLKKQTSTLLSPSQSQDIVSLLRRGGRIAVNFGDIKIVSQINADQTWELKTFARIKKKAHETGDDSPEAPVKIDGKGKVIPGTPGSGKSPGSKTPIRVASGEKPRLLKRVKPKYPEIAKKARIQGKVILDASVDIYGRVIPGSIKVLRGHPLLRQAAVDAVKQWVYEPYIQEGVPKPVRFTLVVDFNLR